AARFARAPAIVQLVPASPGGFDLQFATAPVAAGRLAAHDLSWRAGKPAHTSAGKTELSGFPRPDFAREGSRPGHSDRRPLRNAVQDCSESRQGRSGIF